MPRSDQRSDRTDTAELAVEIAGLSKWYGPFQVLTDIDLRIRRGERLVVCGPSGSGKSTMIRVHQSA